MKDSQSESGHMLRQRAEKMIGSDEGIPSGILSLAESNCLLHELQVQRIELEMQNQELRQSQQALESSRERYLQLFDRAPVGYLTLNEQGNILEANLTVASLLGRAPGTLLNTPFCNYILPQDQEICYLLHRQLIASGMPQQCELRMMHPDSSVFWAELRAIPTRNDECWMCVEDINRRKQAEDYLQDQSRLELSKYGEQYQAMLATELFGFLLVDNGGNLLDVNETYCRMSGYSREELLQLSVADLEAVESAQETARHLLQLSEAVVDHFESRHRAKDGRIFYVEVSTTYLGSQQQCIAFLRDITSRKQAEQALRKSEACYHAVVEDQTDLICRYKPDGRISFVNQAYLRCFGKQRWELIGRNFIPQIPEPDLSTVLEQLKGITPDRPVVNVEHRVIFPDGMVRWQLWIHRGIYTLEGTILEYQAVGRDITDRKQAENALRENKQFLDALLNAVPIPIFFKGRNGRYLGFNKTFEKLFGRTREELIEKSVFDVNPKELAEVYYAKDEELFTHSGIQIYESQVKDTQGVEHAVIFHKAAFEGQNGEVKGLIGAILDITEYKHAELERELDKKRLELLLQLSALSDASQDEILAFSLEAIQVAVQSEFAFIGFMDDAETVMTITTWSQGVMDHCSIDSAPLVFPVAGAGLWGESIRQRVPTVVNEYTAPHPHKRGCPVGHIPIKRFLEIPVFDGERIVAVAAAANKLEEYTQSDINALTVLMEKLFNLLKRKWVEEALRVSREEIKAYMDNSFDVIFALNTQGDFLFASRAWERHFGYPVSEVLGKNFAQFVHPDDVTPCAGYLADILRGWEGRTSPAYRVRQADGTWRWFIANGSCYLDKNNGRQFIGVGHDISERLQAENDLRHAKVAAEVASQAKSDFLATMSHEIRTPLSALLGNIELLEATQLDPDQHQHLKNCRIASEMLLQVINDVLDFSKIEAGKLELSSEIFSVISTAWQLVRIFAGSAEQKGIALIPLLADDLPAYISGDQHRLRQIISNLLSNAIKFTDHGTVTLEITQKKPLANSSDRVILEISVRDTGKGIPLDKQATIFDSFTQLEALTTRHHTGTGLGLSICQRLAEIMGGTISLSSVPDEGSVFTLVLPVTVCQAPQQKQRPRRAKVAMPWNILLADDEELGRATTATLLRRRGHQVTTVANGADLLETLQQQHFDILLSDISMPDMDGLEVVRIIRSGKLEGIDALIPAIAMTAHAFHKDTESFLAAGFSGYVSKPINFEALLQQIDELCRKTDDGTGFGCCTKLLHHLSKKFTPP